MEHDKSGALSKWSMTKVEHDQSGGDQCTLNPQIVESGRHNGIKWKRNVVAYFLWKIHSFIVIPIDSGLIALRCFNWNENKLGSKIEYCIGDFRTLTICGRFYVTMC